MAMEGLRLNLGLPNWLALSLVEDGPLRRFIRFTSPLALPLEVPLMWMWLHLPSRLRFGAMMTLWYMWLTAHKLLPRSLVRRGVADQMSIEAHALGNVLWWVRLIPVNVRRMRFSLAQLDSSCPASMYFRRESINIPDQGVSGVYIHVPQAEKTEKPKVLFWIFGGAFVGGTVQSSMGIAEEHALRVGCDIFMVNMRLYPEFSIEDSFVDACRGYEWLLKRVPPENIVVYGLSSGGGVALRMIQLAANGGDPRSQKSFFQASHPLPQPSGCVLCGAWIRYTTPARSMKMFPAIDWVVTQRVYEYIFPLLGHMCGGDEHRERVSPLYNEMKGLCPLYVSVSEHEVCLDENRELVEKATAEGVDVTLDLVPYMPHAFQWCGAFLPESRESNDRINEWLCLKLKQGSEYNGNSRMD
mmetsp:Transcript_55849/g.104773  ORF Transcript_55849/g.104773 Transcript_55849/m.104773 type:complete len:413 (-) Transcript_55849:72-1310(-)